MPESAAPTAPPPTPKAKHAGPFIIPSLDGLRAVSFLIVFVAHAGLDRVVPGGFGVTVFFFLSGYLITTLMRLEVERTRHVSLRGFYLRRALRILPPFYLVLVAAVVLGLSGFVRTEKPLEAMPIASQALHFSNYWIALRGWSGLALGTGVYWSLAVEEHFYLVFPAVFLALTRAGLDGKRKAIVFWLACAAVLAWRCVLVLVLHSGTDRTYLCSDTRVDSIAYGCALAVWNNPMLDELGERAGKVVMRVLLPLGIVTLLGTFLVRNPVFRETLRYSLQGIALTPVFIAAVRWPGALIFRPLQLPLVRFVGTLSYSLYLSHQVVLAALEQHVNVGAPLRGVIALAVSTLVAWLLYRFVEKPCANLRKRFASG